MLTMDIPSDRGKKKVAAFRTEGHLDLRFAKKGFAEVPSDTAQLAGVVPVIPGPERLNGYLLADSKGRKLIHVNIHGHFRKVRVSMENGDDFARPVQELDFIFWEV